MTFPFVCQFGVGMEHFEKKTTTAICCDGLAFTGQPGVFLLRLDDWPTTCFGGCYSPSGNELIVVLIVIQVNNAV